MLHNDPKVKLHRLNKKYLYLESTVMEMWQEVSKNTNKYNY